MRKKILFCCAAISAQLLNAQQIRVYFQDKNEQQCAALSEKALDRRERHNIDLDIKDLPVNPDYLNTLREMGAEIKMKSRWFNYALISGLTQEDLQKLPFITKLEIPEKYKLELAYKEQLMLMDKYVYGLAETQVKMLNGHALHNLNYLGDGFTIAVIDAGFSGTQTAEVFDSLWLNNRILGNYNFRNKDTNVYTGGSHGTYVLSILGGFLDSQLIGTAPHAAYWLLKSEYEPTETPVEMDHWVEAAEFADSVGADIITSSLGYSTFDSPFDSYDYSDMDGNTVLVTKAADMAASKGILVVVSAGNEGSNSWQYITAPADGDSVLAVGAVDVNRQKASFSSIGPSSDGRIKPDVMALGQGTAVANSNVFLGSGTSFSCPVISGMAACLWQVNPTKGNMEIFEEIRQSADRHFNPNNLYGYGIPNFEHALYSIGLAENKNDLVVEVFPNPVNDVLHVNVEGLISESKVLLIARDASGKELINRNIRLSQGKIATEFPFPSGIYFLQINMNGEDFFFKVLK